MRHRTAVALVAPLLGLTGLLGACGGSDDIADERGDASSDAGPSTSSSPSPAPRETPGDEPEPGSGPAASKTCAEVRAGIDDFNTGDVEGTIAHFEDAVPLAEKRAAKLSTRKAQDLLEAVRYYADLPADEYYEASTTSPDFARYKTITLTQCAYTGPPAGEDDDGGVTI